jgi:mono/diheme cytochrome c family protein
VKGFQPIMPTFQGLVSEEQVNALVAYIKSISSAKPEEAGRTSASTAAPKAEPNGSQVQ